MRSGCYQSGQCAADVGGPASTLTGGSWTGSERRRWNDAGTPFMILKTLLINSGGSTATPPPRCQHTWRPPSALLLALCLSVVATGLQLYYGGTISNSCGLVRHDVSNELPFRIWSITEQPGTNKYVHRYRPFWVPYSFWMLYAPVNVPVLFFQIFPCTYQTVRLSQSNKKI